MTKLFNDKNFWKTAIKLSIPVALQNLLTSSFTLADTLLVSSLGTVALSSVGMMGQWAWLMNMILIGFCSATTVFISQFWGVKDLKKIRRISGISIIFALSVALLFTVVSLAIPQGVVRIFNSDKEVISAGAQYLRFVAFSYIPVALTNILAAILRAVENVKLPMYVSGFTTLLNIFLDYSMIFGKFGFSKLGIRGAALATVISAWLGVVLIIAVSIIQKNILIGKFRQFFSFSKQELTAYLTKAWPVVLNEGMWGAGTFVYNIVFGNMGYEYFSALTIVRSFENISFVLFLGLGSAASVMIGKSIGQGKIERGLLDSKRFMIIIPTLAVIISALIVIFRGQLISIFNMGNNISNTTLSTAMTIMAIYAVAFTFRTMPYLEVVAIFRSGGDTITGAKYELFCLWALSVPATVIAVYFFKVPFVVAFAIMYIFEDIPKNILCMRFYLTKKWIKPVTDEGIRGLEEYKKRKVGEK
ncbi:MAG: MATE family efflux transporter [Eubacterium sp.]|nr:MATE family efflux transporter [Eubacterium sp.]